MTPSQSQTNQLKHTAIGVSNADDTETAVHEVLDLVDAGNAALTLVFYSPRYDAETVARVLYEVTDGKGLGGSTAGEVGPDGFQHDTMVAFSLSSEIARASVRAVGHLDAASLLPLTSLASDLAQPLGLRNDELDPSRHVWIALFAGLSAREEMVVPFFARHAANLNLVGGSFGDEERMEDITLVHDGQVHRNAAAFVLLEYDGPFEILQAAHHRDMTDHVFEVTAADQAGRLIRELDGKPAVDVYAAALGVNPSEIDETVTGPHPLGYRFRGRPFPCSVMRANDDGSLLMAYGVQTGDRLRLLSPADLVESTEETIADAIEAFVKQNGKPPESMLVFHCLGRYQEGRRLGVLTQLYTAMAQVPIVGLNTYGEQFGGMHMNHSLTALMFG